MTETIMVCKMIGAFGYYVLKCEKDKRIIIFNGVHVGEIKKP